MARSKAPAPRCRYCKCILRAERTILRGVCGFNGCINDALRDGYLRVASNGIIFRPTPEAS